MKKAIVILVALSSSYMCMAQENEIEVRDKFLFGLKLGANYSNVYDSEGEDFEANGKLGWAGGVSLAIPLDKYIGLQPEVLFSQKGFHGKGRILGGDYSFTRTTNYIDVPLFITFKPLRSITFLLGPQFSYLISQRDVFKNATTTIA